MGKIILGTFVLVGIYIAVANYTGFGKDVSAVGGAYSQGVKTLQGR